MICDAHLQGPGGQLPGARRAPRTLLALAFLLPSLCVPALSQSSSPSATTNGVPGKTGTSTPSKKQTPAQTGKSAGTTAKTSGKRISRGKSSHHSTRERAQRAPTPQRVREIQSALAKSGYYSGTPTGKWDAGTVAAMKKYQQANDLPASGRIEARTLQKLGLGPSTAGVAAPRIPATPTPPTQAPGNSTPQR